MSSRRITSVLRKPYEPAEITISRREPDQCAFSCYFLGSAYRALAAFALTIDHDKREAFRKGKQAYQHHPRIVEDQPGYYDAYVTIGLYE